MKQRYTFLAFFACLASELIAQQCPPPGFPIASAACNNAPVICQGIDGYCGTLADSSHSNFFFGCFGGGFALNNEQWIAFVAGSTSISVEITPANCTKTGTNVGMQAGLFRGCPNLAEVMDVQCDCTTDPFVLSSDSFIVGETYMLVLDGCAGDVCDYSIQVLEGSTVPQIPLGPGLITGVDTVCNNSSSVYNVPLVAGVTNYHWSLHPVNAGMLSLTPGNQVEVTWNSNFQGEAQLCMQTENSCLANPDTVCKTIHVYSTPNAFISGNGSICVGYSNTVDLNISFSGVGPWGFTPMLTGAPQTPLIANNSPYTMTVSEPGIWTIADAYQTVGLCQGSTMGSAIVDLDSVNMITRTFCPGESVMIGGQAYNQPGIVRYIIPGSTSCNGVIDFNLVLLPQPQKKDTIFFCPGAGVELNGQTYTQPGEVSWTLPGVPCDTLVTFWLRYPLPAPSNLGLQCPPDIHLLSTSANMPMTVDYTQPSASSDCLCAGMTLNLNAGLPSGVSFPLGQTSVCYVAEDACGQTANCCFKVTLEQSSQPCDVKQIGCMRYELMSIQADAEGNQTYRIRVQNNCSNPLIYIAIQLPDGVMALTPADLSTYTSPEGFSFAVRDPNYTPFYSVRYKSVGDSIVNGQAATLAYTLPAQSDPDYIHVTSRLAPQIFVEAHLNTFNCPVLGATRPRNVQNASNAGLRLYPNPSTGQIWVDMAALGFQPLNWRLFNSQGASLSFTVNLDQEALWTISVPSELANGLYFLELTGDGGEKEVLRWVLMR